MINFKCEAVSRYPLQSFWASLHYAKKGFPLLSGLRFVALSKFGFQPDVFEELPAREFFLELSAKLRGYGAAFNIADAA